MLWGMILVLVARGGAKRDERKVTRGGAGEKF